jgi:hypothetical protein
MWLEIGDMFQATSPASPGPATCEVRWQAERVGRYDGELPEERRGEVPHVPLII